MILSKLTACRDKAKNLAISFSSDPESDPNFYRHRPILIITVIITYETLIMIILCFIHFTDLVHPNTMAYPGCRIKLYNVPEH